MEAQQHNALSYCDLIQYTTCKKAC